MEDYILPLSADLNRRPFCVAPEDNFSVDIFALVIFGGTGDLSQKKLLPALYHTFVDYGFPEEALIIGIGSKSLTTDEYRSFAFESVKKFCAAPHDDDSIYAFVRYLYYLPLDVTDAGSFSGLCPFIRSLPHGDRKRKVLYYCAVQPQLAPLIVEHLNAVHLCSGELEGRVVLEKPFGHNRASAVELDRILSRCLQEKDIYRIDHYLAKDTVQNIMFFRFSNSIFEPLWNRLYIDHVQITVAEDIGIGNRGRLYEGLGVVRDVIQNHLLQLLALVAMEPPVAFEADMIRNERVKLFRSIRPLDERHIRDFMVRGQYGAGSVKGVDVGAYRDEPHVAPDSKTATFFAGLFLIDNWRWAGVPFYVRAGKRLAAQVSEINIYFRQPPLKLFSPDCDALLPNVLTLIIQPQEHISLQFGVKYPGREPHISPVVMDFSYEKAFDVRRHPPYERILIDILRNDLTLFARQDEVEAAWSLIDPVLEQWEASPVPEFPNYRSGTWGPDEASNLIERDRRSWYRW